MYSKNPYDSRRQGGWGDVKRNGYNTYNTEEHVSYEVKSRKTDEQYIPTPSTKVPNKYIQQDFDYVPKSAQNTVPHQDSSYIKPATQLYVPKHQFSPQVPVEYVPKIPQAPTSNQFAHQTERIVNGYVARVPQELLHQQHAPYYGSELPGTVVSSRREPEYYQSEYSTRGPPSEVRPNQAVAPPVHAHTPKGPPPPPVVAVVQSTSRPVQSPHQTQDSRHSDTKVAGPTMDTYKDSFRRFLTLYMQTDSFIELAQQLASFARYSSVLFAALSPSEINKMANDPKIDKICDEIHRENLDKLFEIPQRWLNFFLAFESVIAPVQLWRGILDSLKVLRPELLDLPDTEAFKLPTKGHHQNWPNSRMADRLNALGMQGWWAVPTSVLNHFLAVFNVLPLREDIDLEPIQLRVEELIDTKSPQNSDNYIRAAKIVSCFQLHPSMSQQKLKDIGVGLIKNDKVSELPMFLQGASVDIAKHILNVMDIDTNRPIFNNLLKKFNLEIRDIPNAYINLGFLALRMFINEEGWMKAEERLLGVKPTSKEHQNPDSGMRFLTYVLTRMKKHSEAASVCSRYDMLVPGTTKSKIMKQGEENPNLLLEQDIFGPCRLIPREDRSRYLSLAHFGMTRADVQIVSEVGDMFRFCRDKILAKDKVGIAYQEYGEVYDFQWHQIAVVQIAVPGFVAAYDFLALREKSEFFEFLKELLKDTNKRVGYIGKASFPSVLRASFKDQPLDFKNLINVVDSQAGPRVGLSKLVVDTFGVSWDTSNTFSNWKRRPLRESQLHDAVLKAQIAISLLDKVPIRRGRELEVLMQNKDLLTEYLDELGRPRIFLDTTLLTVKDKLELFSLDLEDLNLESENPDDLIVLARDQKRIIITRSREIFDRPNNVPMILIQDVETESQLSQICSMIGLKSDVTIRKASPEKLVEPQTSLIPKNYPKSSIKRGEAQPPRDLELDRQQLLEKLKKALIGLIQFSEDGSALRKEVEDYSFTCNRMFWKQEHQHPSVEFKKSIVDACLEVYNAHLSDLSRLPACWVRLFSLKTHTTAYFKEAILSSIKKFVASLESDKSAHKQLTQQLKVVALQQWKLLPLEYLEPFVKLFLLPVLTEIDRTQIKADLQTMVAGELARTDSARLPTYIKLFDAYELLSKARIQKILEGFITNNQMDDYLSFLPDDIDLAKKTGAMLDPHEQKSTLRELRKRFELTVRDFPKSFIIHCKQFVKHMVKDKGWMIVEEKFMTAPSTSKDPNNPDSGMRFLVDTLSKSSQTRDIAMGICLRNKFKPAEFKKLRDLSVPDEPLRNVLLEDDDFAPSSVKVSGLRLETFVTLRDFGFKETDLILVDKVDDTFHHTAKLFLAARCVGVDGEFWSDTYGINQPTMATLQLATENTVAIFDFVRLHGAPELYNFCKQLFENPNIEIVGHTFQSDIAVLRASFKDQPLDFRNIINVEHLIQMDGKRVGLARLVSAVFRKELCKVNQCSNWSKRPLRRAQLHYGALDAVVTLNLLLRVRKQPQLLADLNGDHLLVLNGNKLTAKSQSESGLLMVIDKSLSSLGAELAGLGLAVVSLNSQCTLLEACQFVENVDGVFLTTNSFVMSLTTDIAVLKFSTSDLQKQINQLKKFVSLDPRNSVLELEESRSQDDQHEPSEGEDGDDNSQGGNVEEMMA